MTQDTKTTRSKLMKTHKLRPDQAGEIKPTNIYGKVVPFPVFQVYRSEIDGCIVVHIDTQDIPEDQRGPIIRVYVNDGVVYENPPFPTS